MTGEVAGEHVETALTSESGEPRIERGSTWADGGDWQLEKGLDWIRASSTAAER